MQGKNNQNSRPAKIALVSLFAFTAAITASVPLGLVALAIASLSAIFAPLFFIKAHDNFKLYRDSQVKAYAGMTQFCSDEFLINQMSN